MGEPIQQSQVGAGDVRRALAQRWVAHVDMDAFFASVEQRDDPALRGRPVIVANSPLPVEKLVEIAAQAAHLEHRPEYIRGVRGVVAAASYEARASGVRSAMPLARALVLCPQAVVVRGRFGRYHEVAVQLRAIWGEYSPVVEPLSLDEAFLDLTGAEAGGRPVTLLASDIKRRILAETALTASVGVASNKLVAKIASDLQKPDGLVVVRPGEEAALLAPMPVRALPGIGPRSEEVLLRLGIHTLGKLAAISLSRLVAAVGTEHAHDLQRRAAGVDDRPVEPPGDPKSISKETTLAEDTRDLDYLEALLWSLGDEVGWQLRTEGFEARCVFVKLRLLPASRAWSPDPGFGRLITRRLTMDTPLASGRAIAAAGRSLLRKAFAGTGLETGREVVRLLGIGVTSLVRGAGRDPAHLPGLEAVEDAPHAAHDHCDGAEVEAVRHNRLDSSLDVIRSRYGFGAITSGTAALARRDHEPGAQPRE